MEAQSKMVIYQVFTRLFGNICTTRKPHGSLRENGSGKLADFTPKALKAIRDLGATHVWYTGIIEHATQTRYERYNIRPDHPAVVKGKAGSPYAIKDYYDVDPDLARDVPHRMQEFEALVQRTHGADLKVIIDFVPNHVARQYHSDAQPRGTLALGEHDDPSHAFDPQNNFYYIPGTPLQGDIDLSQNAPEPYVEFPAKATGNDRFDAWPGVNDWYETVKLNYGVDYCGGRTGHFLPIPDTWQKMRDILQFWADKGIDGFRCDMAEMVPVEFWEWVIPQVKAAHPGLIFIAEVYNPNEYRNYLFRGHFDYLYDKVGLYDTLRAIVCGHESATAITARWQSLDDIHDHMLNFLENHDEQRIASDFFAGDARKGCPAMIVSATLQTSPVMVYFGQELGERGMDKEGFSGRDGRTTIFDYWTVDTVSRWVNKGKFNADFLTPRERELRAFYQRLLGLCNREPAIREGQFFDLTYANLAGCAFNEHRQFAYLRKHEKDLLLIAVNFDEHEAESGICIPAHAFDYLGIGVRDEVTARELLTDQDETLRLQPDGLTQVKLPGYGGKILKIKL
jgi:glycosidase